MIDAEAVRCPGNEFSTRTPVYVGEMNTRIALGTVPAIVIVQLRNCGMKTPFAGLFIAVETQSIRSSHRKLSASPPVDISKLNGGVAFRLVKPIRVVQV